jgi:acyl carrier protein
MLSKTQIEEVMLNAGLAIELPSPVPTDKRFTDLGMDSLDIYNVFVELEVLTGVQVPDSDVEGLQTIDSIYDYFSAKG